MYAPLNVLLETIGHELTKKLLAEFCGERIYFPEPEYVTSDHAIAHVIGIDATRALSRLWTREYVEIPLGARQVRAIVKEAILRDSEQMTLRQLVRKYRPITRRSIARILAEGPAPEAKQRGLF